MKPCFAHTSLVFLHLACQDENHWHLQEKRLFGSSHVVAGINFAKYDDIEVESTSTSMNMF